MDDWRPPEGRYRPRPEGVKGRQRAPEPHRGRVAFLLALLLLVAAGAFFWFRWIGPEGRQDVKSRLRPSGKVSVTLSEP